MPDFKKVKAIMIGVEGELIESEQLHYDKWKAFAEQEGVFANDQEFQNFWEKQCMNVGDKVVYERMKARAPSPDEFPEWTVCEDRINNYYIQHLDSAEIPEGMAHAIEMIKHAGIPIMIVTHAPKKLLDAQLHYIQEKTGITFSDDEILLGQRKDEVGYSVALIKINALRPNKLSIEFRDVLVLDNSKKYLDKAVEKGMLAANLTLKKLQDHLKPKDAEFGHPSVEWTNLLYQLGLVSGAVHASASTNESKGPRS